MGDPFLIRYSSKTAEQNFMKLSGIVHYMMSYCSSYFKFLSAWFWGVPEQNKDFAISTYGGGGYPSLIRYSSKTAEQNLYYVIQTVSARKNSTVEDLFGGVYVTKVEPAKRIVIRAGAGDKRYRDESCLPLHCNPFKFKNKQSKNQFC